MTRPERLRAFELRLDGCTWAQIADEIGYSAQTVSADLQSCLATPPRVVRCCYPALRHVISTRFDNSIRAFAQHCGVRVNAMYYLLSGRSVSPNKELVDTVLVATGLTYEEAFRREEV